MIRLHHILQKIHQNFKRLLIKIYAIRDKNFMLLSFDLPLIFISKLSNSNTVFSRRYNSFTRPTHPIFYQVHRITSRGI